MGIYNSNYESYYATLKNQNTLKGKRPSGRTIRNEEKSMVEIIIKRIIQELIGVLCLFIFVLSIKYINLPQTQELYKYSKNLVDKNYDISAIVNTVKEVKIEDLKISAEDYIEGLKAKITGGKTLKENALGSFVKPLEGSVIKAFNEEKEGFSIATKEGVVLEFNAPSEIKSCFTGTVKGVSEDKDLGQYVHIDHGNGIEIKYYYLEEVAVVEGQKLNTGDLLGRITSGNIENKGYLYLQVLYMGEEKNPENYIKLK